MGGGDPYIRLYEVPRVDVSRPESYRAHWGEGVAFNHFLRSLNELE